MALGISFAAFAAACGDDDGGGGTGGNGGNGASGGSGGSAGSASTAGEGGTAGGAGTGNTAGEGGSAAGQAGTGNAGTAGTAGAGNAGAAGNGSVEGGDAGPDSGIEPDSGVVDAGGQDVVDSGVNGNCPNFATTTALTAAQNSQPVAIVRVTIDPGGTTATVVLRGEDSTDVGGFTLGDIQLICNGPEDADCVDPSTLTTLPAQLALNAEIAIPGVPIADAAEGELVLATDSATNPAGDTFAYVAWGTGFTSATPSTGGGTDWETRAVGNGFWTAADRIDLTGNTFLCGGDTALAASFAVCTADQF